MDKASKNLISDTVASLAVVAGNGKAMEAARKNAKSRQQTMLQYFSERVSLPQLRHKYGEYKGDKLLWESISRFYSGQCIVRDKAKAALRENPDNALAQIDLATAQACITDCLAISKACELDVADKARGVTRKVYEIAID